MPNFNWNDTGKKIKDIDQNDYIDQDGLWNKSRNEILGDFGIGDEYKKYIPTYDDTEETLRFGSDTDDKIETLFEAQMADLSRQRNLSTNLWNLQQKRFGQQRQNIKDSFGFRRQNLLDKSTGALSQTRQRMNQIAMSGFGNQSILSRGSRTGDVLDVFQKNLNQLGTEETNALGSIDYQEETGQTQYNAQQTGFDIQRDQLGINRTLGVNSLHQQYEDRIYDRMIELMKMIGYSPEARQGQPPNDKGEGYYRKLKKNDRGY